MLPVLLDLKIIKIYTFGVFLVLAFFWGMFLLWESIKLTAYKEEDVFDGLFITLFAGLFFSRLFYIILNFSDFGLNILKFILINGYPGLSLYGGFFGGFIILAIFLKAKKIDFHQAVDYFIAPLFLSLAIGKIGAFIAGVEIGQKTKFLLKISYLGYEDGRHLTSLYEGLLFFLAVYLAYKILFAVRRKFVPYGFVFYFFFLYFGAVYFLLDKLKANHLYLVGLSFNLIVSLVAVIVFGCYFLIFFRRQIIKVLVNLINIISKYAASTFQKTK